MLKIGRLLSIDRYVGHNRYFIEFQIDIFKCRFEFSQYAIDIFYEDHFFQF